MARRTKTIPQIVLSNADGSWGDERERTVMLEAYGYVFPLTLVLWLGFAAVAAWFVPIWVTLAMFVLLVIPMGEWRRYTKARGVDSAALAYRSGAWGRSVLIGLYAGACAVSMVVAVAVELNPGGRAAPYIVGGIAGALAAPVAARLGAKRSVESER